MMRKIAIAGALVLALGGFFELFQKPQEEGITLSIWSHEADELAKVAVREKVAREIERTHPGVRVRITWYDSEGLVVALKTALPAGQGPDVFYIEADWSNLITDGYVLPLDNLIDWGNIYPWARQAWINDGKTWAVPQEVYTDELYYNKDLLAKLGFTPPPNAQFSQDQFLDLIKKARAAGITPIVQGVGDRNYPGAYILTQALLHKLGLNDYAKLFAGHLSFEDPRVMAVFRWVKELVDAGAYPKNFMTLKLGESHFYFYQKPGGVMLPMGSWYTGRAFVPVDEGGQPEDFPLGIMQFPAMDDGACNECKVRAVGSSFAINAASPNRQLAADYLNAMSTPEIGESWIDTVHLQTAVKTQGIPVSAHYPGYYPELMARQQGAKYFDRDPTDFLEGACLDTYIQVMNSSFPGGLLSVDEALRLMNRGCYKG
ncbi:MAG TPA: ABC transporter substrate-binding protein [Terriglobia bacterium]|nr:ABC transporter substrate-binding protein [Terriglobia bacterium]